MAYGLKNKWTPRGNREESREKAFDSAGLWRISRLTRDGTAEPVSRAQILRRVRGRGNWNIHFLCSVDHEQDRQPYPVDSYSALCDDHTYILLNRCIL